MRENAVDYFRFPISSFTKTLWRTYKSVTKTDRKQDLYRWKFLRLRQEYISDYGKLMKEAKEHIKIYKTASTKTRKSEEATTTLVHLAKEFSTNWHISEPLDPKVQALPDGVFFYSIGLISAFHFPTCDVSDEPPPGSGFKDSLKSVRQYSDRMKELGLSTSILQININLNAQKTTKIKLSKILTDAQKDLKVSMKGAGKIEYHELNEVLSAYEFHLQGLNYTEIARRVICSRDPSDRNTEAKEKIERAKILISMAPYIPF